MFKTLTFRGQGSDILASFHWWGARASCRPFCDCGWALFLSVEAKIATVLAVCCVRVLQGRERVNFNAWPCRFCLNSLRLLWEASWGGFGVVFGRGEAVWRQKSAMVLMVWRPANDVGGSVVTGGKCGRWTDQGSHRKNNSQKCVPVQNHVDSTCVTSSVPKNMTGNFAGC